MDNEDFSPNSENKITTTRVALKYGLISGGVGIALALILDLLGLYSQQALVAIISYVFFIAFMVYSMREYKIQTGGFMSYAQGLGIGTLFSAIHYLLSGVFTALDMQFLRPNVYKARFDEQMDKVREQYEEAGMSEEQIDQAIDMAQNFMTPGFIFLTYVLGGVLMGFIIALIVSAIMHKRKRDLEF